MTVEVIRVLVYTYEDDDAARDDMGRWEVPAEGKKRFFKGTVESLLYRVPKRTPREQRVLDMANLMVQARNETAKGRPAPAILTVLNGERRIEIEDAIDAEVVPPMVMPAAEAEDVHKDDLAGDLDLDQRGEG